MAIQPLKHAAFKIWTAAAIAIPSTLWLLSELQNTGGFMLPITVLSVIFILAYGASGWLASQLARRMVAPILHEAGVWERSGDVPRAEKAYQKALALFDSFLTAPRDCRRGIPLLIARMARMYAAQTEKHEAAETFLERYLEIDPADQEVAKIWLQNREYNGGIAPHQQDLAARIGDAHAEDKAIQTTLSRLYLINQQTDFPALQTYRRAMSASPRGFSALAIDLSRIFIAEGRSDELALPVYLQAARQQPDWEALRCALAACLRWVLPSESNTEWLAQAREIVSPVDNDMLVRMSSGFVPPTGSYRVETAEGSPNDEDRPVQDSRLTRLKTAVLQKTAHLGQKQKMILEQVWHSPGMRRGILWSLMAGLAVLATVFLVNTVGYLTPAPPPEPTPIAPAPILPPPSSKPYTLQVAAYLKPEHAERYLTTLQKQGIDAYVIKAHSNDKTWYQVRIAHFTGKADALAYGTTLKAKGLIEDFYVAKDLSP